MSESAMDREGSILPENHDSHVENCSLFSNGHTFPSSNVQPSDDGTCKMISTVTECRNDAIVFSGCSPPPSKEMATDGTWMGSTPSLCSMDSKKSKFGCQSASSQIHNKHTEDCCVHCLLACLFCEMLFLCKSISDDASCGGFNACSCCCEDVGNCSLPCCTDCEDLEESCVNSDCMGICSECCGLCFPS
uniref:myoD family inhibitor-like n=1 Tax=Pristiophorus japonicus TaxID=55135 RepID=UPI00398EF91A